MGMHTFPAMTMREVSQSSYPNANYVLKNLSVRVGASYKCSGVIVLVQRRNLVFCNINMPPVLPSDMLQADLSY